MRLFITFIFAASIFALSSPAVAAPKIGAACYNASEAEAEQGVRIHSELMVIGLNCQHKTPKGQKNYYYQYKEFTAKNARLFSGYENILINYYRRVGDRDPEGSINRLRTLFANKISSDAAKMRPDLFCAYYSPRVPKTAAMSEVQIRQWASMFYRSHPLSKPICTNSGVKIR